VNLLNELFISAMTWVFKQLLASPKWILGLLFLGQQLLTRRKSFLPMLMQFTQSQFLCQGPILFH
jgi:hypothetical protein